MRKFSIIIPTLRTFELVNGLIRSFEFFRPSDLEIHYIVVENSSDESYKDKVIDSAEHVTWVQNPSAENHAGSIGNAKGIISGLEYVADEYVFIAHCDICITSSSFFEELFDKRNSGYKLIGTSIDPSKDRVQAFRQSGYYVDVELIKKCDMMPHVSRDTHTVFMDVGDSVTIYCRENDLDMFCYKSTLNESTLIDSLPEPYRSFQVDRCLDSKGDVMFMHLGRGVPKTRGTYSKARRIGLPQWISFIKELTTNDA